MIKSVIIIITIIAAITAVTVGIWHSCKPKTFIGKLYHKTTEITYSSNSETMTVNSEGEIEAIGEDSTTAFKSYILQFYVDGELKNVIVAKYSGVVPESNREDLALQALIREDVEPAEWTHAKEDTEYLVKTTFGSLNDMTPMSLVKIE